MIRPSSLITSLRPHVAHAVTTVITALFCLTLTRPAVCKDNKQPNIVFILIDDLRYDTFSFMQHPFVQTPHIDSLATGGLQFTNAFVTTSLCSPSRASFLTGQYMHNHKVVDNADLMREGTVTFPQLLQKADYSTAFIGKWHMGGSSDAPRPGFDHWVSFRGQGTYAPDNQKLNINGKLVDRSKYMTDELTDYSVEWLAEQSPDQPFMLYLSHKGVHGLYDPAPRHHDRYKDKTFPRPPTMAARPDVSGIPMWVQDQRNSWHGVEFPYHGRAKQSIAEMYRHYCEMILSIDDSVGRVMTALKNTGAAENTLVIFTSDGGHLWGEHGLIDKRCAYEESIRIPMLAHWPAGISAGTRCDGIVANIDVAPTLLELAGLDVPAWIDGRSFRRLLADPATLDKWSPTLLYEYYWEPSFPQTPTTFALRRDRYKLIQYHGIWDTDELFDLEADPHESANLINSPTHQKLVNEMRRQLHQQLKETNGLAIPLGFKRNHGSNLRNRSGTKRSEFPNALLRDPPERVPISK
ncbi:MAG: sulfatase family protein [Planctomycetota bacterium]|jgi:N-acetylglucosamine-6-sulfatase